MQDHNTHRELIAAVASLKSCTRSVILAASPSTTTSSLPSGNKIAGSLQRASDAGGNLRRLLSAASDQTLTLPLSTARRLVEVELPELLEQLLSTCQPLAVWPLPDNSNAGETNPADSNIVSNPNAGTAAAIDHPNWGDAQQLIASIFQALTLLCDVAVRAFTRSSDPLMVLLQLSSPKVMQACTAYMERLWDAHTDALNASQGSVQSDTSSDSTPATAASNSFACIVAAFSSCCSLLAAAIDAQSGLEELESQLVNSLCSTKFLAVSVKLLLSATCPPSPQQGLQDECQHAGGNLLTIALFLSGGDIAMSSAGPCSVEVRPGQHIPSSVLAAYMRQQGDATAGGPARAAAADAPSGGAAAAGVAATEAATGLPLALMQQQLLDPHVLQFLEQRLYHVVREMPGSNSDGSTMKAVLAAQHQALLLPGRCVPDDQDILAAALRTLRCWRALLVGPAGPTLPLASPRGLQLLLAVLNGSLAESIKDSSIERQSLRGRLVRVAVHCIQLLCGCVEQYVLACQLFELTAALSKVVGAAGAYWEANKRAIKSADLPFTGQVRCVDKTTGDMMVRYTMAAQSALLVLQQLVTACSTQQTLELPGTNTSGPGTVAVMLSSGLLPAIEQLFRQVPVVSPAHVAAADLLVQMLPVCGQTDLSAGQLSLLATLRKFLVKAVSTPHPDRDAANAVATKLAELLGGLCSSCCSSGNSQTSDSCCVLLQHAATHLLPALQVYCLSLLKSTTPVRCCSSQGSSMVNLSELNSSSTAGAPLAHLYPTVLAMYQLLAAAARHKPELGLLELLLGNQALAVAAAITGSNYWTWLQMVTAAAQPANKHLTAYHAAQLVTSLLEELLAFTVATAAAESPLAAVQLHVSSSEGCLCSIKCATVGLCAVGNPLCGIDGPCTCGSPKAYSEAAATDAVPPSLAPIATSAPAGQISTGVVSPRVQSQAELQQQRLQRQLLLTVLLQSKLLPELQRMLQQMPAGAAVQGVANVGWPVGASRQGSTSSLSATVSRTISGRFQGKDTGKIGGHSPTYSSTLKLSSQPFRSSSSSSSGASLQMQGSRTAMADFKAMAGTSPPIEGDVGGLLRAATGWNSLSAAEIRLNSNSRQGSGAFGPNLSAQGGQASGLLGEAASRRSVGGAAGQGSVPDTTDAALLPALLPLQLRLEHILVAAGQAVLDVCDSGALVSGLRQSSGSLSATSSSDFGSKRSSWAGSATTAATFSGSPACGVVPTAPAAGLPSRPSFSGSLASFASLPAQEDVFAALRTGITAARPAAVVMLGSAAVQEDSPRLQQLTSPTALLRGSSSQMLFPVDLGLAQLHIGDPLTNHGSIISGRNSGAGVSLGGSSPVARLLSPRPTSYAEVGVLGDAIKGLVAKLQATGPNLARAYGSAVDAEFSGHTLMAKLSPKLVGCWNVGCVNMAGVSETVAAAKPCPNCKVAVFCSKACEKMAWSGHTMACGKLAAMAT